MRVFVAGATGVLGRRVVAECTDRGHEVVGLTRDDRGDALVRERGGRPVRGDVRDRDSVVAAADGADVVVHAATKVPTGLDPSEEAWRANDRVRREGAENLVAAAADVGAERVVQQSVVWVARRSDGRPFDESDPPRPDGSTRSALDAERTVADAAAAHGFDPVVLRCGWFYAHDAAHTRTLGERILAGRLPALGSGLLGRGDAVLSYLHADDAGRAFAAAVEGDETGTFHVVDDEPAAYTAFLEALADRLRAPSPRRIPAWLARPFVGEFTLALLTRSMPTTNGRFREAFDWTPRHPTFRSGLDQVVDRWRDAGTVRGVEGGYEWTDE